MNGKRTKREKSLIKVETGGEKTEPWEIKTLLIDLKDGYRQSTIGVIGPQWKVIEKITERKILTVRGQI